MFSQYEERASYVNVVVHVNESKLCVSLCYVLCFLNDFETRPFFQTFLLMVF